MPMTIAHTRYGSLSGVGFEGYAVFKGVPYAAPPVGALRWKKPQPPIPWQGVRPALTFPPACPQSRSPAGSFYHKEFYAESGSQMQSEDCLYLNIWTPADSAKEKLPVMMWIHGGAFSHGSGSELEFDGETFSKNGVILVTINYRCNALGFLCHPWLDQEEGVSGNYGIYDQIAALDWVRENIAGFGGNPNNITIFGQSAGAMSVQTLISSPLAIGKFHKAIMQSGGGFGGLSISENRQEALERGKAFAQKLGANTLTELRQAGPWAIVEACKELPGLFGPVIDGVLLPDSYEALAKAGKTADVPYLLGHCQEEMNPESARLFAAGSHNWCRCQHTLGRQAPYLYYFDRQMPGDNAGAFHSAELWYVFGTLDRCWRPLTRADQELAKMIGGYWANFAKTGNPNGKGLPRWTPCEKDTPSQLRLGLLVESEPIVLE